MHIPSYLIRYIVYYIYIYIGDAGGDAIGEAQCYIILFYIILFYIILYEGDAVGVVVFCCDRLYFDVILDFFFPAGTFFCLLNLRSCTFVLVTKVHRSLRCVAPALNKTHTYNLISFFSIFAKGFYPPL